MPRCNASRVQLEQGLDALLIENGLVTLTILPEKGADIYEWIFEPKGVDVLWKSPWGLGRHRSNPSTPASSVVSWLEAYEGGWQVLFPNGGAPCTYKGVELNFHGEASVSAWDINEFGVSAGSAHVRLSNRLARSPFRIERGIRLEQGSMHFTLQETVFNEGGEAMDYMWGHHPAYGAPLISGESRIDTNAHSITADDEYDAPGNPIDPGTTFSWPVGKRRDFETDLSRVPDEDAEVATLGYLHDFTGDTAWYGITNPALGLGVGLAWRSSDFPCAWFWQECNASPGFPWYKEVYVMAIEPNTSFPGQGLTTMSEKTGMQRTLQPGESVSIELVAVLYESALGITDITLDGNVARKEDR